MSELQRQVVDRVAFSDETDCWLWEGSKNPDGYGYFTHDNVRWAAHRASYEAFNGLIPENYLVRHTCDTPSCVNPTHLIVGTSRDNARDTASRGRNAFQRRRA
jgi:hypothetical protein